MQRFVESLEIRTLFSGTTAATLLADKALIASDATAVKSDLAQLVAAAKTDDAPILGALKGVSPSTNGPLLKTLKSDETVAKTALTKDVTALLTPVGSLANKSVVAGAALIAKPTSGAQSKVTAAIAALNGVTTTPLATLQTQLASTTITDALNALATANPSVPNLSADIATRENDATTQKAAIGAAAQKFQTDVLALATDLANIQSSSSTIPNIVGSYNGSGKNTSGGNAGHTVQLIIDVTSEATGGTIGGTATATDSSGTNQYTFSGSVTASGKFSASLTDIASSTDGVTLSGTVKGTTISGNFFPQGGGKGSFTVKQA